MSTESQCKHVWMVDGWEMSMSERTGLYNNLVVTGWLPSHYRCQHCGKRISRKDVPS